MARFPFGALACAACPMGARAARPTCAGTNGGRGPLKV